mgnify:CR=1 FL=1
MKISRQRLSQAGLFVLASMFLSSCNRGYGCPTNFEVNDSLIEAVQAVVSLLF